MELIHDDNPIGRDMLTVSKHVAENRVRFANKWGMKLEGWASGSA